MAVKNVTWKPKTYFNNGRFLFWGHDLTWEQMIALEAGEIFTLLDERGTAVKNIFMDSYNQIRERVW